jgi:predicted alpha/beta-hydrolase family hydrolase
MASRVVAAGEPVDALALFAYPLHPPGKPDDLRTEHLPAIKVPTLLCSGDRDAFGTVEELRQATALLADASFYVLAGADHGFSTLKSSGRRRVDLWHEAIEALRDFLADIT